MSPRPCSLAPGLPLSRRPANQLHRVGPLFLLLIIGFSLCSPVAAVDIYPQYLTDRAVTSTPYSVPAKSASSCSLGDITSFQIYNIQNYPNLRTIYVKINIEYYDNYNATEWLKYDSRRQSVDLLIGDELVGSGYLSYNGFYTDGYMKVLQVWLTIEEWDIGTRMGTTTVTIQQTGDLPYTDLKCKFFFGSVSATSNYPAVFSLKFVGNYIVNDIFEWENTIDCNDTGIALMRNGDYSTIEITTDSGVYTDSGFGDREYFLPAPYNWNLTNPKGKTFTGSYDGITVPDPGGLTERTGTVTMTDNNGTTITGFDVTAVNAYTDQSYTVATDTDVAVITLPMERTIQIRNPQTGVYEEAPVGYYRFYGQSPGYKMLNEGGIQVAVMPEKYGSYKLCDIGVMSDSGPLTGKHKFQIRSRSDNSILQTGTISAKSATTGEWYNTTVSGGIATLILPYDTSNTQSQYAGNYYVYATSPGYEDSDYGTQIIVMPHTVSEIKNILLTPIGGIPTPGNVTLRIHAFSETGPGVVNAEIFISGVLGEGESVWDTYTASSTGYLAVSVPGNSTYVIQASGAGYYDTSRRIEVFTDDPPLIELKLYLSGAPTEPTTQPTGWPTDHPPTQPTGGIPDEDDDSEGFLIQAVRGIGLAFGVGFATAKLIFGMLLALSIGYATAKQLRGGAAEFGLGLLGGTLLGVLIGLLPVWIIVVLLLVVGLYIGNRYVGGSNNG